VSDNLITSKILNQPILHPNIWN